MPVAWKNAYYGNGYCQDYDGGSREEDGVKLRLQMLEDYKKLTESDKLRLGRNPIEYYYRAILAKRKKKPVKAKVERVIDPSTYMGCMRNAYNNREDEDMSWGAFRTANKGEKGICYDKRKKKAGVSASKDFLKTQAKSLGLKGYSTLNKSELIALVSNAKKLLPISNVAMPFYY